MKKMLFACTGALLLLLCIIACNRKSHTSSRDETLFLTTNNGNLYSISLNKGTLNWQVLKNFGSRVISYLTVTDSTLIKAYNTGLIACYQKQDGRLNWQCGLNLSDSGLSDFKPVMFCQQPLRYENNLIYATLDGKVISIDSQTQKENWIYDIKHAVYTLPVIFNNRLLVVSGHFLTDLDIKTGKFLSGVSFNVPLPLSPVIDGQMLYIADEHGNIFCYDENLDCKWTFDIGRNIYRAGDMVNGTQETLPMKIDMQVPIAVGKDIIVYGNEDLVILDKQKGQLLWTGTVPKQNTKTSRDSVLPDKSILVVSPKPDQLSSVQFLNSYIVLNTPHYITILSDKEYIAVADKYFPNREIVGGLKYHKGYFYYLCNDGILYKIDEGLKTETPVYKGISYTTNSEYADAFIYIEQEAP